MKNVNVVCAVIIRNDKVFCCRRGSGRALEGLWEFPGGKIEKDEFAQEALKREIKEELKSNIQVGLYIETVEHTYPDMPPYEGFHIRMEAYVCELISGNLELSEHTDSKWLDLSELDSVEWADADRPIVEEVKRLLRKQKYMITKDNEYGAKEIVWAENCSEIEARRQFKCMILEQQTVYKSGELNNWKVIRLFDSKNKQIAQES